jgi:hypothetical protein
LQAFLSVAWKALVPALLLFYLAAPIRTEFVSTGRNLNQDAPVMPAETLENGQNNVHSAAAEGDDAAPLIQTNSGESGEVTQPVPADVLEPAAVPSDFSGQPQQQQQQQQQQPSSSADGTLTTQEAAAPTPPKTPRRRHRLMKKRKANVVAAGSTASAVAVSCNWPGHCFGDPCTTENDCDGSMICINGKCGNGKLEGF